MKEMNRLIWLLLVFPVAIAFACFRTPTNSDVKKIEIKKVDFDLTSVISVNCDDFENYFKGEVKTSVIESQEDLKVFSDYLDTLTKDDEGYVPDVRAKILVYRSDNGIDTLCMSDLGMVYNGVSMLINSKILEFVETH